VLIWTGLAGGDNEYCAILVAVNSILQMIFFATLAILFIKVIGNSSGTVNLQYFSAATSVAVFLGIPLAAAIITRFVIRNLLGAEFYNKKFLKFLAPWSLIGLLFTILILFASRKACRRLHRLGCPSWRTPDCIFFCYLLLHLASQLPATTSSLRLRWPLQRFGPIVSKHLLLLWDH
jgi:predicted Na+-dependent transporter